MDAMRALEPFWCVATGVAVGHTFGTLAEGGAFEFVWAQVGLNQGGRPVAAELFELEDLDRAVSTAQDASGAPPDVRGEHLVDKCLIADPRACRLDAQEPQDIGVETNRDEFTGRAPERRPADAPRASVSSTLGSPRP
jgi:hypothetical protein